MNNYYIAGFAVVLILLMIVVISSSSSDDGVDASKRMCINSKYDYDDEVKVNVVSFDPDTPESEMVCPNITSDVKLNCDYNNKCAGKPVPICRTKKNDAYTWDCPTCNTSSKEWECPESYFLGGFRTAYSLGSDPLGSTGSNAAEMEYQYCDRGNNNNIDKSCYAYSTNSKYGIRFQDASDITYKLPNKYSGIRLTSANDNPYYLRYDGRDMSHFMGFPSDNQVIHNDITSASSCENICTDVIGNGLGDDRDDHTTPHNVPGCSYYVYDKNDRSCLVAYQDGGKLSGTRKFMSGF
jgi:hypothetical protein